MAAQFCQTCGGTDFCLPGCRKTPPMVQYYQRKAWYLRLMRDMATSDRQRRYWGDQLAEAEAALEVTHQKAA